jgi:hypothetical protein
MYVRALYPVVTSNGGLKEGVVLGSFGGGRCHLIHGCHFGSCRPHGPPIPESGRAFGLGARDVLTQAGGPEVSKMIPILWY